MQILTLTHQGQMTLNKNGLDGKGFYGKFYISMRISIARKMGFLKDPLSLAQLSMVPTPNPLLSAVIMFST